ncbi:MAG: pirin family protein [Bacteroidota bacterium]
MEKTIKAICKGTHSNFGNLSARKLLPNNDIEQVGQFVFLSHFYAEEIRNYKTEFKSGVQAHPHRGLVTLTYLFSGELQHHDSNGNHRIIRTGDVQWLNAGNGIMVDEYPAIPFQKKGGLIHGIQFWINLPSAQKSEPSQYNYVDAGKVPQVCLPGNSGTLKLLMGQIGSNCSGLRNAGQNVYLLRLDPKTCLTLTVEPGNEYSVFVPQHNISLNGHVLGQNDLIALSPDGTGIHINNLQVQPVDVIIFGGQPNPEPLIVQGPYAMNNRAEVGEAYRDFFDGKYGHINYPN